MLFNRCFHLFLLITVLPIHSFLFAMNNQDQSSTVAQPPITEDHDDDAEGPHSFFPKTIKTLAEQHEWIKQQIATGHQFNNGTLESYPQSILTEIIGQESFDDHHTKAMVELLVEKSGLTVEPVDILVAARCKNHGVERLKVLNQYDPAGHLTSPIFKVENVPMQFHDLAPSFTLLEAETINTFLRMKNISLDRPLREQAERGIIQLLQAGAARESVAILALILHGDQEEIPLIDQMLLAIKKQMRDIKTSTNRSLLFPATKRGLLKPFMLQKLLDNSMTVNDCNEVDQSPLCSLIIDIHNQILPNKQHPHLFLSSPHFPSFLLSNVTLLIEHGSSVFTPDNNKISAYGAALTLDCKDETITKIQSTIDQAAKREREARISALYVKRFLKDIPNKIADHILSFIYSDQPLLKFLVNSSRTKLLLEKVFNDIEISGTRDHNEQLVHTQNASQSSRSSCLTTVLTLESVEDMEKRVKTFFEK